MGSGHLEDGVELLLGQGNGLRSRLHNPVAVAGEGPAGDAAHQGPRVAQLGQQHAYHVRQVGQQPLRAALADGPQRQDRALPRPPVLLLHTRVPSGTHPNDLGGVSGQARRNRRHGIRRGGLVRTCSLCCTMGVTMGSSSSPKTVDSTSSPAALHFLRFHLLISSPSLSLSVSPWPVVLPGRGTSAAVSLPHTQLM